MSTHRQLLLCVILILNIGFTAYSYDYKTVISTSSQSITVVADIIHVSCNGTNDGSIDITISAPSNPPLSFMWSLGSTTEDISGLVAGNYGLTIVDALSVEYYYFYLVEEPNELIVTETISDVTTLGVNNGTINIAITGGTSPYTINWSNGSSTTNLLNLYAGIYKLTLTDSNGCIYEDSYYIESPIPSGWEVTVTSEEQLFYIDTTEIAVNGSSLAQGSMIGLFYEEAGQLVCGGYTFWNHQSTVVTAFGDPLNTGVGFPQYSNVHYKAWDVTTGDEYFLIPGCGSAIECNVFNSFGNDCHVNCLNNSTSYQFTLNMNSGLNLISLPIDPFHTSFDSIFAPIINEVKLIADDKGHVFWPAYNVNFIGDFDQLEGYQVVLNSSQSLLVEGLPIHPEFYYTDIPVGWSMFGYIRSTPVSINVLSQYEIYYEIIKNQYGQIYWSTWNIGYFILQPGEGYMIYSNYPFTISWPPN